MGHRYPRCVTFTTDIRRRAAGLGGALVGLTTGRLPTRGRGAAVLCYHDVGTDPANRTEYYVSPDLLARHVDWIRDFGLTFVPFAEIVDRLAAGRDLDGLVAMTFDDALVGVGRDAAPILEARAVPATVFVVTDVLGVDPPFWPGAARTMNPDELRELTDSGLITLASHTATHASLPDIDPSARSTELGRAREWLGRADGVTDLLAYPFGHHDHAAAAAARGEGYRAACTFTFGRVTPGTDPFAIPRFCIGPEHDRLRLARQLARPAHAW